MRLRVFAPIFAVAPIALTTSCGSSREALGLYGEFSNPAIFLTDGTVDYSNPFNPVNGATSKMRP